MAQADETMGNQLGRETSPYLLQHRDNPVHWRAWGPEALAEAKAQGKPILLSVGYAACHWCHVMAYESFENDAIAERMNALFVNIKVDREERPDIDTIYQSALSLLGQQGGWPLTMFLTPEGEPFWGGTYFPPEGKWGRPGFVEVLESISRTFADRRDRIDSNVSALRDGLAALSTPHSGDGIDRQRADSIAARLLGVMDKQHGGIGDAPKFPQPSLLRQLWAAWERIHDVRLRDAVLFALRQMCEGGIYDHLGGGFARYTVDRIWLVPHFEKMLYDNAQLVELLCLAWCETGEDLFRQRVAETLHWVLTDMTTPEGAFAAARDADSEGEEGRYYVWDANEIDRLLDSESERFKEQYGVRADGNWEERKNILNRLHLPAPPPPALEEALKTSRDILLRHRETRVPPLKDDKVLSDWNGLMIAALAQAAAVFDRPEWQAAAKRAFTFLTERVATDEGRPLHSFREGRARHAATLDDMAALIRAALTLFETGREEAERENYLRQAKVWAEQLDQHYRDVDGGAYFLTPDDAEALVARTKSGSDNATPSGNGLLVFALTKLAWITGDQTYSDRAEEIVRTFAGEMDRNFFPYSNVIEGAQFLKEGLQIVLIGARVDPALAALYQAAVHAPRVERVILVIEPGADLPAGHPASGKGLVDGKPAAYVCRGPVCSLPLTAPEVLVEELSVEPIRSDPAEES